MQRIHAVLTTLAVAGAALAAGAPPSQADSGSAVFHGKGNCFSCHGSEGRGSPLGPELADDEWVNFDARPTQAETERVIREGVSRPVRHPALMPPMGGARLSDEEIAAVAVYVLELSEPSSTR